MLLLVGQSIWSLFGVTTLTGLAALYGSYLSFFFNKITGWIAGGGGGESRTLVVVVTRKLEMRLTARLGSQNIYISLGVPVVGSGKFEKPLL